MPRGEQNAPRQLIGPVHPQALLLCLPKRLFPFEQTSQPSQSGSLRALAYSAYLFKWQDLAASPATKPMTGHVTKPEARSLGLCVLRYCLGVGASRAPPR